MDELVGEGITSFKLFMAYPGVFYSDDGQILRAMQTAADNGAMIMMHAENGTAIDVLVAQALARGETAPRYHGLTRPWETEEEATHRAIMLAHLTGAPLYVVHMSAKQAVATLAARSRRGLERVRRDLPAVPVPLARGAPVGARLRGREVRLLDAVAVTAEGHQDELWRYLRTDDLVGGQHRPLPVLHEGAEGARRRRLLEDPQRHRRRRAPDGPALPGRRRRPDHPCPLGRAVLHDARADVRPVPAQGRDRARLGRRHRRLRPGRDDADLGRHRTT